MSGKGSRSNRKKDTVQGLVINGIYKHKRSDQRLQVLEVNPITGVAKVQRDGAKDTEHFYVNQIKSSYVLEP